MTHVSLSEAVQRGIDHNLNKVNTSFTAKVLTYSRETQTADLMPLCQVQTMPVLTGVPVVFPRSKSSYVHFGLEEGDTVLVQICQRSLEEFKKNSGPSNNNKRRFHLSDGVAIAGVFGANAPLKLRSSDSSALEIGTENDYIALTKDGIEINGVKIIDTLETLVDILIKTEVSTAYGKTLLSSSIDQSLKTKVMDDLNKITGKPVKAKKDPFLEQKMAFVDEKQSKSKSTSLNTAKLAKDLLDSLSKGGGYPSDAIVKAIAKAHADFISNAVIQVQIVSGSSAGIYKCQII